jgi:hypothetical protein
MQHATVRAYKSVQLFYSTLDYGNTEFDKIEMYARTECYMAVQKR